MPAVQVCERRQEIPTHGRVLLPTLQIFLEDGISKDVFADRKIILIRTSQDLTLGPRFSPTKLQAEEAVIVTLLAIGMSVLFGLTIMLFW